MTIIATSLHDSPVVLVPDAGTERGFTLARALLEAGYRVVATDRDPVKLVRIGHGYSSTQFLLVAADLTDAEQAERIESLARTHFGGRHPTVAPCAEPRRSSAA
jgi:NADP-dependent 3-hydroxy acid dehydrogenase YdfG